VIPIPAYLSPEASGVLGMGRMTAFAYPALEDLDAWRSMIATRQEASVGILTSMAKDLPVTSKRISARGVGVYDLVPEVVDTNDPRVYLDLHGGSFLTGSGEVCRATGALAAMRSQMRTWSVDYRTPPDHRFPAALDDCLVVYRELLETHEPGDVVIGGTSAGGGLAAAVVLRARDEGLPLPAAVVLSTPEVDLTESGDSFHVNLGVDSMLVASLMPANLLYADGHDLTDPYLSPLFGDFSKGFAPTILTTGTRDLFLSNTVRMHRALRAAGITAELHVLEAGPHGGFFGLSPEDAEIAGEIRRFITEHSSHDATSATQ